MGKPCSCSTAPSKNRGRFKPVGDARSCRADLTVRSTVGGGSPFFAFSCRFGDGLVACLRSAEHLATTLWSKQDTRGLARRRLAVTLALICCSTSPVVSLPALWRDQRFPNASMHSASSSGCACHGGGMEGRGGRTDGRTYLLESRENLFIYWFARAELVKGSR